jgi:hypothetical protein
MSIYHQIFHPQEKWQSPTDIQRLEPFMFLHLCRFKSPSEGDDFSGTLGKVSLPCAFTMREGVTKPVEEKQETMNTVPEKTTIFQDVPNIPIATNPENKKKSVSTQYFPRKPDTLFWCVYIALYGMKEYNQIGLHYGNVEIEEKQKMMELMRKTPNVIKNANKKISKVLSQEIMSDFMTNKRTTVDMLMIFAVYNNMRIILVNVDNKNQPDKSYTILGSQIYTQTIVIYKKNNYYGLEMDYQEQKMEEILTNLFCIEQIDKPLKAISNYKIDDLEAIAYKLNVDYTTSKLKKQELYNAILLALTNQ